MIRVGNPVLERIAETFQREVDSLAIPGAVVVVVRDGKIGYEKAIGYQNREERVPMKEARLDVQQPHVIGPAVGA
jgi:hypothetical protein